jgi:hypothetical protein
MTGILDRIAELKRDRKIVRVNNSRVFYKGQTIHFYCPDTGKSKGHAIIVNIVDRWRQLTLGHLPRTVKVGDYLVLDGITINQEDDDE